MMNKKPTCSRCDTPLPEGRLDGLCPRCLLEAGLPGDESPSRAFTPPSPESLAPRFPGYEILALIGRGGMGAVYKALHLKLDRLVAIKILPVEVGAEPTFAERFVREARTLARLSHRGIVTIHDFGETDGLYHFVMEYVRGQGLRDLMRDGPLSPGESIRIATEICGALRYAHDRAVIHRDVKPENVLVDEEGEVRLTDFGLAKLVGHGDGGESLTATHEAMGTPHDMAPEQIARPGEVDARTDLYSLGVLLYEMLTGELPIGKFPPPSARAGISPDVDAIVLQALESDPSDRYADAGEFWRALRDLPPQEEFAPPPSIEAPRPSRRPPPPKVHPKSEAAGQGPLVLTILLGAVVGFLASFLDWYSVLDTGRNAWGSSTPVKELEIPNWIIPVEALLIVALAGGARLRILPTLPRAMLWTAGLGAVQTTAFLFVLVAFDGPSPRVGLAVGFLAFSTILGCAVRLVGRSARYAPSTRPTDAAAAFWEGEPATPRRERPGSSPSRRSRG